MPHQTDKTVPLNTDTTRIILDSISDGVFTIDYNWKITSFNRAAEEITGICRQDAIGCHCWDVFRSNMCEQGCALKKTMDQGKPFVSSSAYIINNRKKRIPITASTALLIDRDGEVLSGVETFRDHSVVEALRKELTGGVRIGDMVSNASAMKAIFSILPQIAQSDSSVLIEGETGTGKEVMARAIHNTSHRKDRPFVAINCGVLPDTLLESELFGYKKGAFTHAVKDKPGHFALADKGTIFLDEIADTSPAFQVRLLRVLQEREYTPLGGIAKERSNVRIIAAANQNLTEMVENKAFRQDLYYRINVIKISLPPLRHRMEDIPYLADQFIHRLNLRRNKMIQGLSPEVLAAFMAHDFPGNIRELENIIEHAFVLCAKGVITLAHLPPSLADGSVPPDSKARNPVDAAQARMIVDALKRNNNNRSAAARDLGIHKSTLFRRIRRLGLQV